MRVAIQTDQGEKVVEFDGTPTDADIDEVASHFAKPKKQLPGSNAVHLANASSAEMKAQVDAFDADSRRGMSHSAPEVERINALRKQLSSGIGPRTGTIPGGSTGNLTPITPEMRAADDKAKSAKRGATLIFNPETDLAPGSGMPQLRPRSKLSKTEAYHPSKEWRDFANRITDNLTQKIQSIPGVPLAEKWMQLAMAPTLGPLAPLVGNGAETVSKGVLTPLHLAAEAETIADPREKLSTKAGAAANLALTLLPIDSIATKYAGKGITKGLGLLWKSAESKALKGEMTPLVQIVKKLHEMGIDPRKSITPKTPPNVASTIRGAVEDADAVAQGRTPKVLLTQEQLKEKAQGQIKNTAQQVVQPNQKQGKGELNRTQAETVGISNRAQAPVVETGHLTEPVKGTVLRKTNIHARGVGTDIESARTLASDVANGRTPFSAENVAKVKEGDRLHHLDVNAKRSALDEALKTGDKTLISARQAQYDASVQAHQAFVDDVQKGKTEWHNTGKALQDGLELDTGNFAAVRQEARRLKGGDLKPKEEGQADFLTKRVADLEKKVQDMESAALKRDAEAGVTRIARQRSNVAAAARGERNVLVKEADYQQALKDLVPTSLNAGLDPKIAGALAKIATYHVERGTRTAAEVAKLVMAHAAQAGVQVSETDAYHAIHEALGKVGRKANQGRKWGEDMLISGKSGYQSPEVAKTRKELDLAKAKVHDFLESQRPRTLGEKIVNYQQANILSSPMVFGKLAGATVGHAAISPVEEGFGSIIGRLFPGFREKAGTELRGSVKGEAKALGELLNPASFKDAWQKLTTGHNSLNARAIAEGIDKEGSGRGNIVLKLIRNSHGAMKTPLQRAAFAREYEKQLESLIRAGAPVDDTARSVAFAKSYAKSQEAILMNNSAATQWLSTVINSPKRNGTGGQMASAGLKTLMPITRVATNFAGRALEYQYGLPYALAKRIIAGKGADAEATAAIARAVKRGGAGLGLITAGYNMPKDVKLNEDGEIEIKGEKIPTWATHVPIVSAIKIGLSMRDSKGNILGRYGEGLADSTIDTVKHLPAVDAARTVTEATRNTKGAGKKAGQIAAGLLIPQAAQQYARGRDKAGDRRADNFFQEIQKRVPILREKLPPK